jgi:hypothetical protein
MGSKLQDEEDKLPYEPQKDYIFKLESGNEKVNVRSSHLIIVGNQK